MSLAEALPTHTPYDGSSKLFSIGLKPLDPADWIEVDDHLLPYLAEKHRLYAEIPERVFVEEDGTRDAQQEVLDLLGAHLLES
ncbi:heme-dependent oxidative N-demethylase subunit alpha family protein, partial [Mesorhizobium sp. M7D.F.Ca.US.004.01.2.1]